jgi:hypothetical protein
VVQSDGQDTRRTLFGSQKGSDFLAHRRAYQLNDVLRAALIVAGKELAKRKIAGKGYREMLRLMRDAVREARATVKSAKGRAGAANSVAVREGGR